MLSHCFFLPILALSSSMLCGVCGTVSTLPKPPHQPQKFGISLCEACRKFISRTKKKLASPNVLQCHKNDGMYDSVLSS